MPGQGTMSFCEKADHLLCLRCQKSNRPMTRTVNNNALMTNESTVTQTDRAPSWMRPMPIAVEIKIGMNMVTPW